MASDQGLHHLQLLQKMLDTSKMDLLTLVMLNK